MDAERFCGGRRTIGLWNSSESSAALRGVEGKFGDGEDRFVMMAAGVTIVKGFLSTIFGVRRVVDVIVSTIGDCETSA